jgi:hypothetical protein
MSNMFAETCLALDLEAFLSPSIDVQILHLTWCITPFSWNMDSAHGKQSVQTS